jgi:hypothetical protein
MIIRNNMPTPTTLLDIADVEKQEIAKRTPMDLLIFVSRRNQYESMSKRL